MTWRIHGYTATYVGKWTAQGEVIRLTRITVVIPTYNRAEALRRALESLCAQTLSDFYVIISDNCSTDDTDAIVADFQNRLNINYLKASENFGPIPNWDLGLKSVTTEWVKILWSDDWLEPSALEALLGVIDEYGVDVALCGSFGHLASGVVPWVSEGFESENWVQLVSRIIAGTVPVSATAGLLRTSAALEGLRSNILDPLAYSTAIGPDLILLYWPAITGGTVGYLAEPLVNMFAGDDSISIIREDQLRPLYSHAVLMACKFGDYKIKRHDQKMLEHRVREGVILKRIPELQGTFGKISLRIAITTWPTKILRRYWTRMINR